MLEGHFAPMKIGGILVALNTRLSGREISYILNHSESKVLVFDSEFGDIIEKIKPELKNNFEYEIKNTFRSVGTRLSHYIYKKFHILSNII